MTYDSYHELAHITIIITGPPSAPMNLAFTSITSTSLVLMWDPPVNTGGRVDIIYNLWYQERGNSDVVNVGKVAITTGIITGTCPHY